RGESSSSGRDVGNWKAQGSFDNRYSQRNNLSRMPCGFESTAGGHRLPVGLQLIGPRFEEAKMLALADHFQLATNFHEQTPDFSGAQS
ncbi:MAG: hypothetical protein ACO2Y4_05340, partial [Burkholderiaceae bacterium]